MKNYKTINEAIKVAEELLKTTKQNYENCVCNAEWDIKFQIGDYIYNLLRNADFPIIKTIQIEQLNPPIESFDISFSSAHYMHDGIDFQYQLFIRDYMRDKVSRIYFNTEEYYEDSMQPIEESTLLALITVWKTLKSKLSVEIDNAYQTRINKIKKEKNEILRKQEILKSFSL